MLEVDSSGVKVANGNLKKFIEMANKSAKSATTFDDVMNLFNLNLLATSAGVAGLVKAFKGLVSGLKQVASLSIQNYSSFESMQKGLETFFQSAEKGKSKFEELRKLSNQTTFGVDELADSFTQLANVGMAVDTINEKLMMLGDLSGGNKMKFAELVSVYSKIQSTGKAGSMQLEQIATKGIPIYDMLKKIGVEGTATANDVTKAFQEMTKKGGQFYNAMSNINDTIEGKEGFISDYFKEMTVNFAEASGIAEAYKGILDTVREAIGAVSDWLLKINENPVSKAIFQGTLAASLTLVGTLLAVTIVSALKKVGVELKKRISELTVIQALSGPAGWKNLAVAGIVAATAGVTVLTKELIKAKDKADDLANSLPKGSGGSGYSGVKGFTEHTYSNTKELEQQLSTHSTYLKEYEKIENEIRNLQQQAMKSFSLTEIETLNKYIAERQKDLETYENAIAKSEKRIAELKEAAKGEQFVKDVKQFEKDISDMFDETSYGNSLSQLQEFEKELNNLNAQYGVFKIAMDGDSIKKAEAVINEWKEKVSDMKIKIAVDSQTDWQKKLQQAFGFTDKEVANGATKSTVTAIDEFGKINTKREELYAKFAGATGYNKGDYNREYADQMQKAFFTVLDSVRDGTYSGTEDSLKEFAKAVEEAQKKVQSFSDKLRNFTKTQVSNGNVAGAIAGTFASNMLAASSDATNFVNGMAAGGVIGGVANAVGGALATVAQEVDGMDDVLNPLTAAMRALTPIFELFIGVLKPIFTTLDGVKKVLSAIVEGILRPFEPLIRLITSLFEKLANLFTKLFDSLDPIIEVIDMLVGTVLNGIDALLEPILQGFSVVGEFFNIFTELTKPFMTLVNFISSIIKLLAAPLRLLAMLFENLAKIISDWTKPFTSALEGVMDWIDDFLGYEDEEESQTVDLTDAYKSLLEAMKANEEEYEKRKKELNSADYASKVTGVHDMILTPQGNFSTDPDDYIIATKNPSGLNGGNGTAVIQLQPIINNTMADTANVETRTEYGENGMMNLIVKISRKVAQDYADGTNGWDNAVSSRAYRQNGRSLVM